MHFAFFNGCLDERQHALQKREIIARSDDLLLDVLLDEEQWSLIGAEGVSLTDRLARLALARTATGVRRC